MNTLHLAYAVEVERCGSITQAAENLYMAQPNLSKAMKELEESLGFPIFRRSSRGVTPTARGREFLVYARSILAQVRNIEALADDPAHPAQRLSLALPHTGLALQCFSRLVGELSPWEPLNITLREMGAAQAIAAVADGTLRMGVLRWPVPLAQQQAEALQGKSLAWQPIREYDALLLFSSQHPLAQRDGLAPAQLAGYPRVRYGDEEDFPQPAPQAEQGTSSSLQVFHRAALLQLLRLLPSAYCWSAPEEADALQAHGLAQRPCAGAARWQEVLIYPAGYRLSPLEQQFAALLQAAASPPSL